MFHIILNATVDFHRNAQVFIELQRKPDNVIEFHCSLLEISSLKNMQEFICCSYHDEYLFLEHTLAYR